MWPIRGWEVALPWGPSPGSSQPLQVFSALAWPRRCEITSREYCDFMRGYFHEEATLCSQVGL